MVEKPKKQLLRGGWGLKKPKITQNMPKLGHYLPFEQKFPKIFFLEKKIKIKYVEGWKMKKKKQTKICINQVIKHKIQK